MRPIPRPGKPGGGKGPPKAPPMPAHERSIYEAYQLVMMGKRDLGLASLRRLQSQYPDLPLANQALGQILFNLNKLDEAEIYLRKAYDAEPNNALSVNAIAAVYARREQFEEALPYCLRAHELDPKLPDACDLLCVVLAKLDRIDEAIEFGFKASRLVPQEDLVASNLIAAMRLRDLRGALEELPRQIRIRPNSVTMPRILAMDSNYLSDLDEDLVVERHRELAGRLTKLAQIRHRYAGTKDPNRKLRIGFVSSDLRKHSVAFVVHDLVKHLDRGEFHVTCFHVNGSPDAITHSFRESADEFHQLDAMPAIAVSKLIFGQKIDILIDLNGYTHGGMIDLLALKSAPVQVTMIGYPNTTGLPAMDARIVDWITDPAGEESRYTEQLVRLDRCFLAYNPFYPLPDPRVGEREPGEVIFGTFNNLVKLSDQTGKLWSQVLHRVPHAKLLMKSMDLANNALKRQAMDKLDPAIHDRVICVNWIDAIQDHQQAYERVDFALDPQPYNGTVSTIEALSMGVPVISMRGPHHRSRVSSSLLTAAGYPEWINESEEQYVERAVQFAADVESWRARRGEIAAQVRASPIFDTRDHAQHVGRALRQVWKEHCVKVRST